MNLTCFRPLLNRAAGRLLGCLPIVALPSLRCPAWRRGFAALAVLLGVPFAAVAAPGDVDLSFTNGIGPNGQVLAVKVRTNDNKIYIGGVFDAVNGNSARRIARLSNSGAFDTTFVTGGAEDAVNVLALYTNSQVVIGGNFTFIGNTRSTRLARLNDNGSLDTAFTTAMGTGPDGIVDALAVQDDGKVVVGGRFFNFNGTTRRHIARLNADGSLDTTFNPGTGPNNIQIISIIIQPDGKMLLCGDFTSFAGVPRVGLVRLNADGTVDTGFDTGVGATGPTYGTLVQPDGKIILYGGFNLFNNQNYGKLVRLLPNGTIDTP